MRLENEQVNVHENEQLQVTELKSLEEAHTSPLKHRLKLVHKLLQVLFNQVLPWSLPKKSECKYNIVAYGIKDCQKGSSRHVHVKKDTQAVRSHIQSVDPEIPEQSLRGCVRLGKYSDTKCRPILAKLSRSHDVSLILATRGKLASNPGMSVKPDMTPQERATEINFVARM